MANCVSRRRYICAIGLFCSFVWLLSTNNNTSGASGVYLRVQFNISLMVVWYLGQIQIGKFKRAQMKTLKRNTIIPKRL